MNITYIVTGIFALIGVVVSIKLYFLFYFFFGYKYKQIRDNISITLKDKYHSTKKEYGGGMLGNLIGGFIVIIIGINLITNVAEQVSQVSNATNVTGAGSTILGIVPLFFALGIMVAGISLAIGGLRNSGLI